MLINFIDLSFDEKVQVLQWRNDYEVRRWMYDAEPITEEEHLSFIGSLEKNTNKLYFVVRDGDENIGVIDFTNILSRRSLHMGLYANPYCLVKGKGNVLVGEIIRYAFDELNVKKIYSEVFSENIRAYKLYQKFGFKEISVKKISKRKIICMGLIYEDRKF